MSLSMVARKHRNCKAQELHAGTKIVWLICNPIAAIHTMIDQQLDGVSSSPKPVVSQSELVHQLIDIVQTFGDC